jgi:hypothetical protein
MSYSVTTAPEADEALARLPPGVRIGVLRELLKCVESPSKHAHRTPAREPGMVFRLEIPFDDMTAYADAFFQYEQDEKTIFVWRIRVEFL